MGIVFILKDVKFWRLSESCFICELILPVIDTQKTQAFLKPFIDAKKITLNSFCLKNKI